MPVYYFHVCERDGSLAVDQDGTEFSTETKALESAYADARDLAAASIKQNEPLDSWVLEVRDAQGILIKTVAALDVIQSGLTTPDGMLPARPQLASAFCSECGRFIPSDCGS